MSPTIRRFSLPLAPHRRVFAAFFLYAFSLGGLFPRLAELQRSMDLSEGELGLGLIGAACGTLLSLTLAGRLIERVGHRITLLALMPVLPVFYALAAHASGTVALFLCLLPAGLCIGAIELVVNLEADRVEHQGGRRIMNRSHAFWSFGFFGAGLLGAMAARVGISPQLHLASIVPLSAVLILLLLGGFEAAPHRTTATTNPPTTWRGRRWRSPHWCCSPCLDSFSKEPASTGRPSTCATSSTPCRSSAGWPWPSARSRRAPLVMWRTGSSSAIAPLAIARTLLGVLGLGTLMVTFAPASPVALLGFALMGVGTSVMFPLAMSAAAQRTDRPAATNVAALAQISFVSFLLGPPLLGFVAEHLGIRWTFGVGLPLVVLSVAVSSILRQAQHRESPAASVAVSERVQASGKRSE